MDENITQTQPSVVPPPSPTTSPVQPPKSKKLVALMIVIHLIAVAVIGYLIYQNIQFRKQISLPQPTPLASIAPTILPTADPTANWKTYTNEGLGIKFKYPNNLVVSERVGERPVIIIDTKQSVIPEMFDTAIAPIEIMLDLNSNTYTKAVENAKRMFEASSLKVEVLNNEGIVGSLIAGNVLSGMRSGRFVEAYFDNGANSAIVFSYEGYSTTYKNTTISEEMFTQIVKTVSSTK